MPTERLEVLLTGKSLLLHGPVEGDALLSALDLVASPDRPDARSVGAAAGTAVRGRRHGLAEAQ
ncbi:hypothetical protein ACNQFN_01465 [Thauera butanivorans]|uniref:hypothetical protein n=1 Tax=Thauera butanivorans TaxID=86174 RepID=UPI003AB533C6